jgi:hypothetical protein
MKKNWKSKSNQSIRSKIIGKLNVNEGIIYGYEEFYVY